MASRLPIVLTGGGTAGHVMPHLAILETLRSHGFDPFYVGSKGIEKDLATKAGIPFHQIATGKLRRYFSVENFLDIFRIILGFAQSLVILTRIRPAIVFSKGGFVAVPVTLAAWILRIPIVTHESDYSPGLANKIILPFTKKILYTFVETQKYLPAKKSQYIGTPVRPDLFKGDRQRGLDLCGFTGDKPVLLVMGGSQGAKRINDALKEALPKLIEKLQVVHLTGKGKSIGFEGEGYKSFEFLGEELKDVLASADLVISRAGANSIFELLSLVKPMLLIPLELGSRGDQILNAKSFVDRGWAKSLSERDLNPEVLIQSIFDLEGSSRKIMEQQKLAAMSHVPERVVQVLMEMARQ